MIFYNLKGGAGEGVDEGAGGGVDDMNVPGGGVSREGVVCAEGYVETEENVVEVIASVFFFRSDEFFF